MQNSEEEVVRAPKHNDHVGRKGYRIEPPPAGQDAMQMSGIFIISTAGQIELPYYFDHIADHPPLDLLLSGVFSTRWDRPFDGPVGAGND